MNNHKTKEANEKSEKILDYISANSEQGVTIKDIGIAFNMPAETARHYVKALYTNGYVDRKQQGYGATHRYFWKKPEDQTQNVMEDKNEEAMGGVERDPDTVIKCGEFCKAGDVVECSSRSGDGLFFKYLVITPWERKAMVLGIFQEGHPNINLNDPNQIYIGDDPETSNKLYVDITNVCQRGYKTFGKRLFHAEKENMDDVKNRLRRVMGLASNDGSAVFKEMEKLQIKNDRLSGDIRILKKIRAESSDKIKDLEDDLDAAKKELGIQCKQYEQQIDDLNATLDVAKGTVNDYAARFTLQKQEIEKLNKVIEEQCSELDDLRDGMDKAEADYSSLAEQYKELKEEFIRKSENTASNEPEYDPKYVDTLVKLKIAETRVEDYDYFTYVMKDFVMNLINKGGN